MLAYLDPEEQESMGIHLMAYQKSGIGWDEYRKKIPAELLAKWRRVLAECRRNGYVGPYAEPGKDGPEITFQQLILHPASKRRETGYNLCSLCEKACARKDARGVFMDDTTPCWDTRRTISNDPYHHRVYGND